MTVDEGCRSRFELLYTETRVALLGYLARRTPTAEDAVDLLAEVYLVAWRRIESIPEGERARLYLFGVARNVLGNHRRSEHRRRFLFDRLRTELGSVSVRSSEALRDDPRLGALDAALATLDPVDRELITLNVWEGLTAAEIAVVTDRSTGSVRVRLHRARTSMSRLLADRGVTVAAGRESVLIDPTDR